MIKLNKLSVILPTLNEEGNIIPLINTILKYNPLEILVIDDNSQDKTISLVRDAQIRNKSVKLIVNNPRRGLTPSIQQGIDSAKGEFVLWMDADFSHPPKLIPIMFAKTEKFDIVVGSWLVPGGKDVRKEFLPRTLSWIINKVAQIMFGNKVHAYTSGYIVMKRNLFDDFKLKGDYGEYCIDLLVRQSRLKRKITEVPFICKSREHGETKTAPNIRTLSIRGVKYLKTIYMLHN